jgi:hypothetical protein
MSVRTFYSKSEGNVQHWGEVHRYPSAVIKVPSSAAEEPG